MTSTKRLDVLVTAVLVAGVLCLAAAALLAVIGPTQNWWRLSAALVLGIAGGAARIDVRVGSNRLWFVWGEASLLVGLVFVDLPWAVLAAAAGVIASDALGRVPARKLLFNVGMTALATAAAGAVLHHITGPTVHVTSLVDASALLLAAVIFFGGSLLAVSTAIAWSQDVPVRTVCREGFGLQLLNLAANVAAAFAVLGVAALNIQLLVFLPPALWATQEGFAGRVRARAERRAWRRLADVTQQLTALDPEGVVRTAIAGAGRLFSADTVEIALANPDGVSCYRGDRDGLYADSAEADHSLSTLSATGTVIREPLGEDPETIGELRLCFAGQLTLNEREQLALTTLAAALAAALRNAQAHLKLQDLARRKAYEAAHDPLTGLANRAGLREEGAALLEEQRRAGQGGAVALLLLDLNHFKEINDTLGHASGDRVLAEAARRLAAAVEPTEVLARLGGDEFAVLTRVPDANRATCQGVSRAEAIRAAITGRPIRIDDVEVAIEASVGVAATALGRVDLAELLRRADVAMYQAKRAGTDVGAYEASRDAGSVDRLALAGELRAALQRSDELIVHLQPVIDLRTGEPLGAEALARWNHPRRGMLPPGDFIDTVEESELAGPFTRQVLDLALAQRASWTRSGLPPLAVSVNLPVRLLLDRDFPAAVAEMLARHRVPPGDLVLEITERVMMSELETVDAVLASLRQLGVQLSIDDFGTGYSSLSLLTRLPVTEVKIDRSFVAGMADSSGSAVVVRTIVEIGRSLGLRVVAEGIETETQKNALAALGCTAGQGYLFCAPADPAKAQAALWAFASRAEVTATAEVIPMGTARRPAGAGRRDRDGDAAR